MKYIYELNLSDDKKHLFENQFNSIVSTFFAELLCHINSVKIVESLSGITTFTEACGCVNVILPTEDSFIKFDISIAENTICYLNNEISLFKNVVRHELFHCKEKLVCFKSKFRKYLLIPSLQNISVETLQITIGIQLWSEYYAHRYTPRTDFDSLSSLESILMDIDTIINIIEKTCCHGEIKERQERFKELFEKFLYGLFYHIVCCLGTYDGINDNNKALYEQYAFQNFEINKACCHYIHDTLIQMFSEPWGKDFDKHLSILTKSLWAWFEFRGYKLKFNDGFYFIKIKK